MDGHAGALLASACMGHHGNTGGGQPNPTTIPPLIHHGSVAVPQWIKQVYSAVQEGDREEVMAFRGGGGKGGYFKDVQRLWAHPRDGLVLQVPG